MDTRYFVHNPRPQQGVAYIAGAFVAGLLLSVLVFSLSASAARHEAFSLGSLAAVPRVIARSVYRAPAFAASAPRPISTVRQGFSAPDQLAVARRADTRLYANKLPSAAGLMPKSEYCKAFGRTLVVGGGRGLGLALSTLLKNSGCEVYATVRKTTDSLNKLGLAGIIEEVDMTDYEAPTKLTAGLGSLKLDTVIHVAGYFTTEGPLTDLNRKEEVKMFEICAIAPVFVTAELLKNGNIGQGTRVGFITSEGGSIGLRTEKEGGANYGHHMSKAASNMAGRLMAWDLKPHGVSLVMIHPGFLRTEMTANKYAHLYDELGAVTADEAAPFILQPVADVTLETTGRFVAALGSQGLGLGAWALPMKVEYPADIPPGGELPF